MSRVISAVAGVTSHHESLAGHEGEGPRMGSKVDDEDFEFVKTLMVTLTSLSRDPCTVKVSLILSLSLCVCVMLFVGVV